MYWRCTKRFSRLGPFTPKYIYPLRKRVRVAHRQNIMGFMGLLSMMRPHDTEIYGGTWAERFPYSLRVLNKRSPFAHREKLSSEGKLSC